MYSKDHVSKIKNNDVKVTCSDFCHSNYFIEQANRSPLSSKIFNWLFQLKLQPNAFYLILIKVWLKCILGRPNKLFNLYLCSKMAVLDSAGFCHVLAPLYRLPQFLTRILLVQQLVPSNQQAYNTSFPRYESHINSYLFQDGSWWQPTTGSGL